MSINQLNIVIGISVAFFSNYVILRLGQSSADWVANLQLNNWNWRWMLGIESLPAIAYYLCLKAVPESPRWLAMHNRQKDAIDVLTAFNTREKAQDELTAINASIASAAGETQGSFSELLNPTLRKVMIVGLLVAVLQQITGINSVFFYAPMIFEQSGIGTDAAFMQAVLVGLTNLLFTIVAMLLIDKLGRKPLLVFGVAGIAACMLLLSWGFGQASYALDADAIATLPEAIDSAALLPLQGQTFHSDTAFRSALTDTAGAQYFQQHESELLKAAINIQPWLILAGILGFVACFAVSIGPVMWVLFSELFPNRIRGVAISVVGLVNSGVSFLVQLLFPWQLTQLGNSATFLIYGAFAAVGLLLIIRLLPETRGMTLEEVETDLVGERL